MTPLKTFLEQYSVNRTWDSTPSTLTQEQFNEVVELLDQLCEEETLTEDGELSSIEVEQYRTFYRNVYHELLFLANIKQFKFPDVFEVNEL